MERESMPVDVLFVGGGPACLAGAIHLMDLIAKHNETSENKIDEPTIAVIEKGSDIGSHAISGAVLDPKALEELFPNWREIEDFPVERFVEKETFVVLTQTNAIEAPMMPPGLADHGLPIVSIAKLQKWLAAKAEEAGVMMFPGFAGTELLWDDEGRVRGVRTGDKGIDNNGNMRDDFEPGMDLEAKVTILGEGPRGHLTRQLIARRNLDRDSQPMVYELGCKEILELPPGSITKGEVVLTLGYPLGFGTFGGAFMYTMEGDRMAIGILAGLDAKDPALDLHYMLQKLKNHPYFRKRLEGGKVVKYGAKTVSVGGWASVPRLYADGAMIVGDSASFLNPARIKGIHLSMKTGMLAAETALDAMLADDASERVLAKYKDRVDESWIKTEMEPSKNFHSYFEDGVIGGMARVGMSMVFGPGSSVAPFHADYQSMQKKSAIYGNNPLPAQDELVYDGTYLVDKLTDVFMSGTKHDEHQPAHLIIADTDICKTRCAEEYGNPCERFCPAQVYNMVPDEQNGGKKMQVDFSNCVHCKTCDIRDPYQIIQWVPPQAGEGPEYQTL